MAAALWKRVGKAGGGGGGKGGVVHCSRELKSKFHDSRELKPTFHESRKIQRLILFVAQIGVVYFE